MQYENEKNFIIENMQEAYNLYASKGPEQIKDKQKFDIVTDIDLKIEKYLIEKIKTKYPNDFILSEEFLNLESLKDRTWTIDPIDGTFNFVFNIAMYGVQCSLIIDKEIVMSAIILPRFGEVFYAIKDQGAYLNNKRIKVASDVNVHHSIISFGDYQHHKQNQAKMQHTAIGYLQNKIAKIRMFGAACIDFSFVASGKTAGTVVFTKNLWDLAPGILIAKEAGALITNIFGKPYSFIDIGVVVASSSEILDLLIKSFNC